MSQTTINVQTPRGAMPVHLHEPEGNPQAPLVVLFMDAPGVRPALHLYGERLADAGYRAAIPDLYFDVDPADLPDLERLSAGVGEEFGRMAGLAARIDDAQVLDDTELLLRALRVGGQPWACVGFCLGGRLGFRAAQRFGDELAAAALLHPSQLVSDAPDAPYLAVDRIGAEMYLGFGENDHVTPLSQIPPIEESLTAHGVAHEIEVIRGMDHGFMMQGMPSYDQAGAEQGWAGAMTVLGERLPPKR
jgi:carboxymethylenebutenolidase